MSNFPEAHSIGTSGRLTRMSPAELDSDPRGILWMWEPPSRGATYCLGIDVSEGRTGWNRYSRIKEDRKTDNGAIEVLRIGKPGSPDMQVAEYAAPLDPFELGDVANLIGRLYAGTEDDQCKCMIEVHPGPGTMTFRHMMERGYTNHVNWQRYADTVPVYTRAVGWYATNTTNRDLWIKAARHLNIRSVVIKSPWLAEEYADCRMNPAKGWADNPGGHDDRVRAFNLALWVANGWSMDFERTAEPVRQETGEPVDWARSDMSRDDIMAQWAGALDKMSP